MGFFGIIGNGGKAMTVFKYNDYLRLDDETANDWEPMLSAYEESAIAQAKALNPNLDVGAENETLKEYCKEWIFLEVYAEDITSTLLNYHQNRLANYEEQFRYGVGGK